MRLIPKNWTEFQHYKDRSPPWIKLHRAMLNDRAYMTLPTASKALAPLMWLLASESKSARGEFDASTEELEFRLRMTAKEIEVGRKALISKGFFVVASSVLADGLQGATPETEVETEKEVEGEPAAAAPAPTSAKRKTQKTGMPDDFAVSERVKTWAAEKGYDRLAEHLDAFRRKATAKGYTYVDWDSAFMEAIREDWAKLRGRGANGAAPPPESAGSGDPDSKSAIEAEGIAKGLGAWDEIKEQWHVYKARVRGIQPSLGLDQLAAMAARRAH